MARKDKRAVRKLEQQIAKTQEKITQAESKKRRRGGLFGGILLGTVAGGLLTYYLARRNQDDEWETEEADNAIVLREQPLPTGQTADIKPLPTLNAAPAEKGKDEVAETTLEETSPATEAKQSTTNAERPATLTGAAQAQPPKATAIPTEQPTPTAKPATQTAQSTTQSTQSPKTEQLAKADQPTKTEQTAKTEQPVEAKPEQTKDAPLPVETERPEIVLAKASGHTDEELAEDANREPEPALTPMRAEPVDGTCPASHPIKGNRGSMGALIYHVPGGRNYDRTKPEACFATIEDAEKAGYRAPRG